MQLTSEWWKRRCAPHLADLADTGEVLGYLVRFLGAVVSPRYRGELIDAWTQARPGPRALMALEGMIAAVIGLGVPLVLGWVLYSLLR